MSAAQIATETAGVEAALERLPEVRVHTGRLARRLAARIALPEGARILDVGAAQGLHVTALTEAGFRAVGVEPWEQARKDSEALGLHLGGALDIRPGVAESLPFPDQEFYLVIANSVMEHATDPLAAAREAYRVLRPGGGFYFSTTSILSPRQSEIRGFPAFSWYPDPVKKRIMRWAARERPGLIGHTQAPAYNWFSPSRCRTLASESGFQRVLDRWDLHLPGEVDGWRVPILSMAKRSVVVRRVGDVFIEGSSYLFIK